MENTTANSNENKKNKSSIIKEKIKSDESLDIKKRYIYTRDGANDLTANLIDELLIKCNQKDYGATVDFSMLLSYVLKLIKDSDIETIQNLSLTDEDRVNNMVKNYNIKNGTNFTMYEFVLNGLQLKSKKGVNHEH